jgi:hypothetical protein
MARMTSLVQTDAERMASYAPSDSNSPNVPPGMCLCLTERELEKMGISDEVEVGDLLHLMVMIQATAVHKTEGGVRVECSVIAGCAENESTEGAGDMEDD